MGEVQRQRKNTINFPGTFLNNYPVCPRIILIFVLLSFLQAVSSRGHDEGVNFKPSWRENNRKKTWHIVTLREDEQPGHIIAELSKYVRDRENDRLSYGIDAHGEKICRLNRNTGTLTLNSHLDREDDEEYKFRVYVSDNGVKDPRRRTWMNIGLYVDDVNDNKPEFEGIPYTVTIREDLPVGTQFASVHAKDRDDKHNALVRYSFSKPPPGDKFLIDAKTGNVSVKNSLDFENKESYILFIKAKDQGFPSRWTVTTLHVQLVDVNDTPPEFLIHHQERIINENTPIGTSVCTVSATDGDTTESVRAEIRYMIVGGDEYGLFHIDPVTGNLTVKGVLDREFYPEFKLEIKAYELNDPSYFDVSEVRVALRDCNDNKPKFQGAPYHVTVYDTSEVGQIVSDSLRAIDEDATFENNNIRYSLTGQHEDIFGVSPHTGELVLRQSLLNRLEDVYHFKVIVSEASTRERYSDTADVTVQVKITCLPNIKTSPLPQRSHSTSLTSSFVTMVTVLLTTIFLFLPNR